MSDLIEHRLERLSRHFGERRMLFGEGVLAYRECGAGPAVVLLHGISSGAASWLPAVLPLAQRGYRVIAWDAPGYGASSALPMGEPSARDYASCLLSFIKGVGAEGCVLVGHSLGALMAAAAAADAPDGLIRRLVLVSPARGYGDAASGEGLKVHTARLATLDQLGVEGMASNRAAHLLSPAGTPEQQAWVRWNMQRLKPNGYRQAVAMLCGDDIQRYLPPRVPASVHVGNDDTITTPASCRTVAEACQVELNLIPSAGHACYIENPEEVARLI